ncbi:MAG: hypothetical protein MK212_22030 [Saprospiraceae bacterium]|nr:hypothetical protein [Saprospiraceae bacterium]
MVSYEAFSKALEIDPANPNRPEIEEKLRKIGERMSSDAEFSYIKGSYKLASERYATAAHCAVLRKEIDSSATYMCAAAADKGGYIEIAVEWYSKSININYNSLLSCVRIVDLLRLNKRYDQAYSKLLNLRKSTPEALI